MYNSKYTMSLEIFFLSFSSFRVDEKRVQWSRIMKLGPSTSRKRRDDDVAAPADDDNHDDDDADDDGGDGDPGREERIVL